MPIITSYPYIQYGGIWTTSQATDAVAAGTWAVPPTPKLFGWGDNTSGRLGTSNTASYNSPKQVGSLGNWSLVSGSYGCSASVKTDGTLWTWGKNSFGQLGLGNTTNYSSPKQVGALTNWLTVSCGTYFMVATKTNGTLWSWGKNGGGELGLGNTTYYSSPVQVGSLTNWSKADAGTGNSTVALKADGTLWSWGLNYYGQLGLGNQTDYSSPKQIGALTDWKDISNGYSVVLALKNDGTLWAWGGCYFNYGVMGQGNTAQYSSPKQIGSLTNWLNVASGYSAAFAVKTDNTLWAWGWNNHGCLGTGNTTNYSSPKQIGSLTNWLKISAGNYSTYAIKTDGTLWSWGWNINGELGLGNNTQYSSPKQVGALTTWSTVKFMTNSGVLGIARTTP